MSNNHIRIRSFCFFSMMFLILGSFALNASASTRVIAGINSSSLKKILRDDFRNLVYAVDNDNLYIINTSTERVIKTLSITGPVVDMSANKAFTLLDIVAAGMVTRVDLIHETINSQYSLPGQIINSVTFDANNDVYVWAYPPSEDYPQWGWIYKLDTTGTKILTQFGTGTTLNAQVYQGLVRTNSSGTTLYVGQMNQSPLSISSFDISGASPVFLMTNPFAKLGENLEEFAIAPDNSQIYIASGYPYGFQIVNSSNFTLKRLLTTRPYPKGVALNLIGNMLYGIESNPGGGELYEYNLSTIKIKSNSYPLSTTIEDSIDLTIDRGGDKAFVILGNPIGASPSVIDVVDLDSDVCVDEFAPVASSS